jgi:pyrroline-5-carboxylate reductase
MLQQQIAYVGTGQMARALAQGLVAAGVCQAAQISGVDPDPAARDAFQSLVTEARVSSRPQDVIPDADIVVLATKPQHLPAAAAELAGLLTARQLVISIAAGVTVKRLVECLGTGRVVRVMPNTPCLVRCGASAFALGPAAADQDAEVVRRMLSAVGTAHQVDEAQLDAVTGLSGSGPAYIYLLIEALSDGGVRVGLPRSVATNLAAQTVRGAAEMVLSTGDHPAVLKDRVASPGGTTIAGLERLERRAVRGALMEAVEAAAIRARELGNE